MVAEHRNPCTGIEKFPEGRHERYLTPDELQRLLTTLDRFEMERRTLAPAVAAVRLLIVTGCRRDEILNLRWSEVYLERSELVLPDSKTGRKRVFLNEPAQSPLAALPRDPGSDLVINGKTPGRKLQGLEKIWQRIRREAELEDVRLHDLRQRSHLIRPVTSDRRQTPWPQEPRCDETLRPPHGRGPEGRQPGRGTAVFSQLFPGHLRMTSNCRNNEKVCCQSRTTTPPF